MPSTTVIPGTTASGESPALAMVDNQLTSMSNTSSLGSTSSLGTSPSLGASSSLDNSSSLGSSGTLDPPPATFGTTSDLGGGAIGADGGGD
jgi:hypothetical protein